MRRSNRRRTTRSGSGLEETNGGEVLPIDGDNFSEQSNVCSLPKTPQADNNTVKLEESRVNAIGNGYLDGEMKENGKGNIGNSVCDEEEFSTPKNGTNKICNDKLSGSPRLGLVLGLPSPGQFEKHQSRMSTASTKKLGTSGETNVLQSSHRISQISKEAVASSSVVSTNPRPVGRPNKRKMEVKEEDVREAASSVVNSNPKPVGRPKKRKMDVKKENVIVEDEYTIIKKKLRYLLNRISYEQSLIDAYSLEGWKGSSAEKLRPEKELERAKTEILRRKVKIRELFQHLDTLCGEGNLPEALFDSDGEISSEDIFCSKCGSKEVSLDNDIILCDGFCDRGFHQYCVQPPLLKEDIPPDDESWLCPACDCKDVSLDLLNDSLGTKLSVTDSWEKVFPEAVVALAGGIQNLNFDDLPSDDSEDEEYDPDGLNDNKDEENGSDDSDDSDVSENGEDGSSNDESGFSSASDEMIESFNNVKDIMALPSDDSEDDDFDPDAMALDEEDKINSDCSSDSEDVETSSKGDDDDSTQQDGVKPLGEPANLESDTGIDDDVPGRRKVARLDYKKLYDDEYGNVQSSSSDDDDDWDKSTGKEDSDSGEEEETLPLKQSSKVEEQSSTKNPIQRSKRENKQETLKAPQQVAPVGNGCSDGKSSSSAYKQTDPKTERLLRTFEENRYPDRTTKESLAEELQMTYNQVNTWFLNKRYNTNKTMGKLQTGKDGKVEVLIRQQTKEIEMVAERKSSKAEEVDTSIRKTRQKSKVEIKEETLKTPQENGCSDSSEEQKKRLFKAFQVNRSPDLTTRKTLAKELQMTVNQINNWFRDTRFSTSKGMVLYVDGEGGTSVAGSSKQIVETNTGSRKRKKS